MKKQILAIILALAMLLSVTPVASFAANVDAASFAGGSGTADDPYQIENADQLANLKKYLGNTNKWHYKLTANIDLGGVAWSPIGSGVGASAFQGTLDGDGHTISNLSVTSGSLVGLFGYIVGANISNIIFESATVKSTSSSSYAGTLAARAVNSTVRRITVNNSTISAAMYAGGIIGDASADAGSKYSIISCGLTGTSTVANTGYAGTYAAGGILGGNTASSTGQSGTIEGCFNTAVSVKTPAGNAGGIVGYLKNKTTNILNCYNTSKVFASGKVQGSNTGVGGILGYSYAAGNKVYNSYNTGAVSAANASDGSRYCYAGGMIGYGPGADTQRGFNVGTITGTKNNPIRGYNSGTVGSSYYENGCSTGTTDKNYANALSHEEMLDKMNQVLPNASDSNGLWQANPDGGYPILNDVLLPGAHEHTFGNWVSDGNDTHTGTCTADECNETKTEAHKWDDGKVTTEPTCGAAGEKTYTCTVCGETKTETVPATGNHVDVDGDGKCDVCGQDTDAHKHVDADGDGICDGENCGAIMAHPGENHTWGAWEKNDGATHIRHCTKENCNAFETEAHKWDDGRVTTEPTCGAAGEKTYTCTVCGETKTEEVAATGNHVDVNGDGKCDVCGQDTDAHKHVDADGDGICDGENCGAIMAHPGEDHTWGAWEKNDGATHIHYCTKENCNAFETEAHKWDDGRVTTEPTCGAAGEKTYTCTVCGETKTEEVAATGNHVDVDGDGKCDVCGQDTDAHKHVDADGDGICDGENCGAIMAHPGEDHTWGAWEKNDGATHIHYCTKENCNAFETEAHKWDDGKVTSNPTCGATGVKTYTCTVCGETKTETVPATGNHVDVNGDGKCDVCGQDTDAHKHVDADGDGICDGENCGAIMAHPGEDHTWGAWEKNDGATHIHHCTKENCNAFETEAHKWDDGKVTTNPTCGAAGEKTYTCTVCGETKTETVPATGNHVDVDGDGKCDVCGQDTDAHKHTDADKDHKCDYCGAILGSCTDKNNDHKCDYCGNVISDCVDNNNDGKCDICGKELGTSNPEDPDHTHVDSDLDGKCDVCGKDLHNHIDSDCICHKALRSPFYKVIYKIVRAFWKLFGINKYCKCGYHVHYI